jgi:site-specific recombinase XerD
MPASTARTTRAPEAPDRSLFKPYFPAFVAHLRRAGARASSAANYPGPAKHFLVWLHQQCIEIQHIDGKVLWRFLDHRCTCPRPPGERYQCVAHDKRQLGSRVLRFIGFLEERGDVRNPMDLADARQRVEAFATYVASEGCMPSTVACYRRNCVHFITWLHQQHIPLTAIDDTVVDRFAGHDCICPGAFTISGHRDGSCLKRVARFVRYLATTGVVARPAEMGASELALPLAEFQEWMRRHRGTGERTMAKHLHLLRRVLPELGPDPGLYDASLVRSAILQQASAGSRLSAQATTGALRMYFRYLASTGQCAPSLVDAIPTVPRWRLATLPRYIVHDDVERVIASCDLTTSRGLRDHAILLLLARLALRAGDVVGLRLSDIDWNNALIRVAGKSAREVALPLPQNVGDSLAAYIEHARPRIPSDRVFLRSIAPFEPLAHGSVITGIVRDALNRAGIRNVNLRGAYLLRHSAATHLLRSGLTLEAVGALLRHRTTETTAIYAKVDTRMLARVVQPWIGGVTCR